MHSLPEALQPLAAWRQFIICQFVPDTARPGKTFKYPIDLRTGTRGDAHDPALWLSSDEAIKYSQAWNLQPLPPGVSYGVGFTFTENDPFFFLDIDSCITPQGYTPIVAEVCALLHGAAIEISHSGRGLHIFGMGKAPTERKKKEAANSIELYTEKRFVALTGTQAQGSAAIDCTAALQVITERYFKREVVEGAVTGWTTTPVPEWNGPEDDDLLISRALRSQSAAAAFGSKASFRDLWMADMDALSRHFPHDSQPYDASTADSALAQHLAFWTGKDCERIKRLMFKSALVREKWNREAYIENTITGCVVIQQAVLTDKHPEPVASGVVATMDAPRSSIVTGNTYLNMQDQIDLFAGCVYVQDQHRAMTPSGHMLRPEQFKVAYGGYTFSMDDAGRRTVRNAWEAFTESQMLRSPRVDTSTFRPELTPGCIINEGGLSQVNIYVPVDIPRRTGDPTPFLIHLRKLLPDVRDQCIVLSYMAACVQHKGTKFQWCPFIQGVEGNGKTLFSRCVAYAVGERYSHFPRAEDIKEKFNAWQLCKIFIGVEDIYIAEQMRSTWETFKPMITGERQAIEPKGIDATTKNVCCNYILNSNHKNGIPKTQNDRRAAMFFTAQQSASDLTRDGMGGDYFPKLYNWLKNEGGFAIVSELLHTYPIAPEFDPTGSCQRAPLTSTTDEAVGESLGRVEQEVMEAIAQGLQGFAGGWISSMALDRLIEQRCGNTRIAINQRRAMLQRLGYDWHPGLLEGRVHNLVQPDNGKPRLFCKRGSEVADLLGGKEIAEAYTAAQLQGVFV